ncbi:MAG: low molecular weight protein-tyrosine-phosphatase [Spongiibacter sp.]|nr:low molecular weight protein-tyrosine-phosphatase [Spongiibacter sp.]
MAEPELRVLLVCLGNICRSPAAHGVLVHQLAQAGLAGRVAVDSAGTGDWHVGRPPDPRMLSAAQQRGYDLSPLRARQVCAADFDEYDYILAMDNSNLVDLRALAGASRAHIALFLSFGDTALREVPDPYYGGDEGFVEVLELVEAGSRGLIARLKQDLPA